MHDVLATETIDDRRDLFTSLLATGPTGLTLADTRSKSRCIACLSTSTALFPVCILFMVGWFWFCFSISWLACSDCCQDLLLLSVKSLDMDIWLHFFWVDLVGILQKNHGVRAMCSGLRAAYFCKLQVLLPPQASNWEDSLVFYYVCNCYLLRSWKSASGEERKNCSFLIGSLPDWKSFDFLFLLTDSPVTV